MDNVTVTAKQEKLILDKMEELRLEGISYHHILLVMGKHAKSLALGYYEKYGHCLAYSLLVRASNNLQNLAGSMWED